MKNRKSKITNHEKRPEGSQLIQETKMIRTHKSKEEKKRKRKKKADEADEDTKKDEEISKDAVVDPKEEEEQRTVFVGNLPESIDRKELASMFKSCGKIKSTRIRSVATAGVKVVAEHAGNQVRFARSTAYMTILFFSYLTN